MKDSIIYRLEREGYYRAAENVTREAFWDVYKPGCDEHLVVRNLRSGSLFLRELTLVAEEVSVREGMRSPKIIGAIYCSVASIVDGENRHEEVYVGPLAVLPEYQRRGIGGSLLTRALDRASDLGFGGAFLYGNPEYYRRFGFSDAALFNVHPAEGDDIPQFMGRALNGKRLASVKGRCFEDPSFRVDAGELAEFDRLFPPKEKHVLPGQLWSGSEA
jgi:Predicted acetyltransferase